MKPRTIADALIAKHGCSVAHTKVLGRMRSNLGGALDNAKVHRAIFWMVVGQMVERAGNTRLWV